MHPDDLALARLLRDRNTGLANATGFFIKSAVAPTHEQRAEAHEHARYWAQHAWRAHETIEVVRERWEHQ